MVCLRFCQHSGVTFLKEFQQCLNTRYLASTCLSLYTLISTASSAIARDVTRGIQYRRTAIRWYISCISSQLFHLKKYQEIKKSKNPSYLALAYLPQRQWMNYTTNLTLRLQSIPCPLRGKLI